MTANRAEIWTPQSGVLVRKNRGSTDPNPVPGWSPVFEDQFATFDSAKWGKEDSTFGAPTRIQRYLPANVVVGPGSSGATNGTSMKLLTKRETVGANDFTAGMIASKNVGYYLPRYFRIETRQKIPHGQGLWSAFWTTAKNGGASMCELDIQEYFHSQIPGKILSTLHRTNNAGVAQTNVAKNNGGYFWETPTYTPDWVNIVFECFPTSGDPTLPNTNVRLKTYINGVNIWDYTDTSALYWTTNGGSDNSFHNLYIQGCQVDGNYVGHPDDALGYSHWLNQCLISGSPPASCSITYQGRNIIRAQFGDPSSTYELDYIKAWKYTG